MDFFFIQVSLLLLLCSIVYYYKQGRHYITLYLHSYSVSKILFPFASAERGVEGVITSHKGTVALHNKELMGVLTVSMCMTYMY